MDFKKVLLQALLSDDLLANDERILTYFPKPLENSYEICKYSVYVTAIDTLSVPSCFHYTLDRINSFCIIYTKQGNGSLIYKNKTYSLTPHTLCFIDCRNSIHSLEAMDDNWTYTVLFFDGNPIRYYYQLLKSRLPILSFPNTYRIESLILAISNQSNGLYELKNSSTLINLLTELVLLTTEESQKPSHLPTYLISILHDFNTNYMNQHSLDSIATSYHLTKSKICRDFMKYLNISPIQYLNTIRIDQAQELLKTTTIKIYEIAYMVGFDNTNYFIKTFKKHTSLTPSRFRELNYDKRREG